MKGRDSNEQARVQHSGGSHRDPAIDGDARFESATRAWVAQAVIGLHLCPFAAAVQARGLVRYTVSPAVEPEGLLTELQVEMRRLVEADPSELETTLLIHPHVLQDFTDYNDFLDVADSALAQADLDGVLQVASFHPHYRFEGTDDDDITNATNRSPYPVLQLLREASVERALEGLDDPDQVCEANMKTFEKLGAEGWRALSGGWQPG